VTVGDHQELGIHQEDLGKGLHTTETEATLRIDPGGTTGAMTTRIDDIGIGGMTIVIGGTRVSRARRPAIHPVDRRRLFCTLPRVFTCQEQ